MKTFKIIISPTGEFCDAVYDNALENINNVGKTSIWRASEVAFDNSKGCWQVQGRPPLFVGEPILKTGFSTHKAAILWEVSFLQENMPTLRRALDNATRYNKAWSGAVSSQKDSDNKC